MNRKQRRALKKATPAEQRLASQTSLFGQLPEMCNICQKAFDKTDRDMVLSWSVVVRTDPGTVRLFCPDCIKTTQEKINERQ
tara:strand:+ start:1484 stop:1729 length:246 start_codon:yes stop_codon:yes gene_type:complete